MTLYHYTALEHAPSIRSVGISVGGIAMWDGQFIRGAQWLTDEDNWRQPWASRKTIHCDRMECRLEVRIPKPFSSKLWHWPVLAKRIGWPDDAIEELNHQGGGAHEHWYVYQGVIPHHWLREFAERPATLWAPA